MGDQPALVINLPFRGVEVGKGVSDRLYEGRPAVSMCGLVVVKCDCLGFRETKLCRRLVRESVHRVPISL
ncbi:hypothetical protein RSM1_21210 [Methylobacterium radiotolerans]|nr:hypothetical protein RSM1_21210 [Methylobacterium radiotolerans]